MDDRPEEELTRVPVENDLVTLARELNRLGVAYVEIQEISGVPIPFASAELMLRMKQSLRPKDAEDRSYIEQFIHARGTAGDSRKG